MDLRQLRAFVAVAREASFTRAAVDLNHVQSAVSAQIKALELDLGVPLFDRLGRRVVLTDAGKELLGYAVRMLDLADEARAAIPRPAGDGGGGGVSGTLAVGASETLCVYRLPGVLRAFRARFPEVDLRFRPVPYHDLKGLVRDGTLDAAYLFEEPVREEGLASEPLARDPLLLVAPPDHPLSRRARVALPDLGGEPMLLTDAACLYRRRFERVLAKTGVAPGRILEFDNVEAIKRCAMAGLGVAVLPEVTVQGELDGGTLVRLGIDTGLAVDTQIVWHAGRWRSPALDALLTTALDLAGEDRAAA